VNTSVNHYCRPCHHHLVRVEQGESVCGRRGGSEWPGVEKGK
jgi:hypothetical protein